jgi:hypothetical protein
MSETKEPPPLDRGPRFWLWSSVAAAGWLGSILLLEARNPRLVPSWHGFLHSAIVERFPSPTLIPENPFFAGAPLKYYWFFHWLGAGVVRLSGLDPLNALRLVTLIGLVGLVLSAALAGRRAYRSLGAGLLIGVLAMSGANPLGPLIALGRFIAAPHQSLLTRPPESGEWDRVHVSDALSDRLMSRPLLPAMYISADWRNGQNIVWFFDISSRGLALAALMALLCLLLAPRSPPLELVGLVVSSALVTALNPIVGLAVAPALGCSLVLVNLVRRRTTISPVEPLGVDLVRAAALVVGAVLAYPTYYHLFGQGGNGGLSGPGFLALKVAVIASNFLLLLPLAILGARATTGRLATAIQAMALTGTGLVGLVLLVHLEKGNEHNLANAAYVLLAVPAAAWVVAPGEALARRRRTLLVAIACLPMTMGTWLAFDGRPTIPFATREGMLRRTPDNAPLAQLYRWIDRNTPPDAIFVVDPTDPVKMSGNVSELPAFTGRTLFVDEPSYMTTPYPDAAQRTAIATRLSHGDSLTAGDADYLRTLGRPFWVVSSRANVPGVLDRMSEAYGPPQFVYGEEAIFEWHPAR